MTEMLLRVTMVSAAVSVVLLPLLLVSRWQRRYAPHTRRAVWLVIAAALLAAPLLPKAQAPVRITVPAPTVTIPASVPAVPQRETVPAKFAQTETPVQTAESADPAPAVPEAQTVRTVEWGALLAVLWLAGGLAILLWQGVVCRITLRRLMRGAEPLTGYEKLAAELCPHRSVRFFQVNGLGTPMTLGVLRPVVLLPEGEVRPAAVHHELTHIRRWDVAWKILLLLSCVVHWFNPLVWVMSRRADRDMEASCDAAVLSGKDAAERRAYGELLLETAAGHRVPFTTRFGGGKKLMKARLYDLFHPGKRSRVLVVTVLLFCLLAGSLVAFQPQRQEQNISDDAAAESLALERTTETLPGEYDFDHDGEADTVGVVTVWSSQEENVIAWYELQVKAADGMVLWTGEAAPSHPGWNSLFTCTLNGEDYLLRYNPTMYQGFCGYDYRVFSLSPEGEEIVLRENSVSFDTNFGSPLFEGADSFDANAIADFMDDVNSLLARSKLLLSTDQELEGIDSEHPQHTPTWLTRDNSYFGYTYDDTKTMRENLLTLEQAMKEYGPAKAR